MRRLSFLLFFVLLLFLSAPFMSISAGGGMDIDGYCRSHGYAGSQLTGGTAYDWKCVDSSGGLHDLDLFGLCRWQYGGGTPVFSNFNDPNSWTCQDNQTLQQAQPQPAPAPQPAPQQVPTQSQGELGQNCQDNGNGTVTCQAVWVCSSSDCGATRGDPYIGVFELPYGAAGRITSVTFNGRVSINLSGDRACTYLGESRSGFEYQGACVHGVEYAIGTGRATSWRWSLTYDK